MAPANQKVETFLMFDGKAEEAMTFYISLFPGSKILDVKYYGSNGSGPEGTVELARFSICGHTYLCMDTPVKHNFTFTPSVSMYVNCESEEEIETLFKTLSKDGTLFMPLAPYPFSKKFGWVADRFGISWQLNLAK